MEPKIKDWEISKLYSQAWEIIKKNKWLWILGLAAGGGFSFNNAGNSNFQDFNKIFNPSTAPNTPHSQNFSDVLGAATSSPFTELIKGIFNQIPSYFYLLLGLEILLLILVAIIIGIIYNAWAQGLLINSTLAASQNHKIDIFEQTNKIMPKIRSLIWLNLIPGLIFVLIIGIATPLIVLGIAAGNITIKLICTLLAIIEIGAFIYWLIMLNLTLIWAPRLVVFEDRAAKIAFFAGLKIAKKKFWASLFLGLINNILALLVIGIPLALIFGLIFGIVAFSHVGFLIPLIIPLILAVIIGLSLLGGAINGFKATVWTLAYKQIKGKYDS